MRLLRSSLPLLRSDWPDPMRGNALSGKFVVAVDSDFNGVDDRAKGHFALGSCRSVGRDVAVVAAFDRGSYMDSGRLLITS